MVGKKLFYFYNRAMWYMQFAKGEITKPLQFWNEALLILTFLAVKGVEIEFKNVVIAYLLLFTFVVILGKILVKLGMLSYQTRLNNSQNPEIMEILERVKRIERNYDK